MFNVYLPKLLETRNGQGGEPQTLEQSLWDVVIFTIGGCPGALVGCSFHPGHVLIGMCSLEHTLSKQVLGGGGRWREVHSSRHSSASFLLLSAQLGQSG